MWCWACGHMCNGAFSVVKILENGATGMDLDVRGIGPMAAGGVACMRACVHDCGVNYCVFVQQSDPWKWQDRHGSGQVVPKWRNEDAGNVNHRFIVGFSEIVIPLIRLTCKEPLHLGPRPHQGVQNPQDCLHPGPPSWCNFNPDNPIVD